MKRFIAVWILLSAGLNIWQMCRIAELEEKRPIIVYKADNSGAEIKGRVTHKEKIGDTYTITVQNYGVFVVTQTNYESLKIGDEVILLEAQNDFLKGLCNNQLEIIMDYEWKQMQEQAAFIKANTRKWGARCG